MKDALRLLVYLAATILIGSLLAPVLFWTGQSVAVDGILPGLAKIDFERYFHRALLVAAIVLLWPFLRLVRVRRMQDLGLERNPHRLRDLFVGLFLSAVPLLCGAAGLLASHFYDINFAFSWATLGNLITTAAFVSAIEEFFFRGLILGLLLRSGQKFASIVVTSAIYAIVHFLKAPERTSEIVTWTSGFNSIAHSFAPFRDAAFVASAFTTLFLIGCIMADARIQTRSLWLPAGLHAGWIVAGGVIGRILGEFETLPWIGKNPLVGIVPLAIGGVTWFLMRAWLKHYGDRKV